MTDLAAIAEAAHALLAPLATALPDRRGFLAKLRPAAEDYGRVFQEHAVLAAHVAYAALWRDGPSFDLGPRPAELLVFAAWSDDFAIPGHARAAPFPGGYPRVASLLVPGVPWLSWRLVPVGAPSLGVSFDGLVWIDGHWAWFPKPWRALAAIS